MSLRKDMLANITDIETALENGRILASDEPDDLYEQMEVACTQAKELREQIKLVWQVFGG